MDCSKKAALIITHVKKREKHKYFPTTMLLLYLVNNTKKL